MTDYIGIVHEELEINWRKYGFKDEEESKRWLEAAYFRLGDGVYSPEVGGDELSLPTSDVSKLLRRYTIEIFRRDPFPSQLREAIEDVRAGRVEDVTLEKIRALTSRKRN